MNPQNETDPNSKVIQSTPGESLFIDTYPTFPHPSPSCPRCHRHMGWFKIRSMQIRGWFCTCPDEIPLEGVMPSRAEIRVDALEKALAEALEYMSPGAGLYGTRQRLMKILYPGIKETI
jgi:hypothetical protein